jgi:hypothetical protein
MSKTLTPLAVAASNCFILTHASPIQQQILLYVHITLGRDNLRSVLHRHLILDAGVFCCRCLSSSPSTDSRGSQHSKGILISWSGRLRKADAIYQQAPKYNEKIGELFMNVLLQFAILSI